MSGTGSRPSRRSWARQTRSTYSAIWSGVPTSGVLLFDNRVQLSPVREAYREHAVGAGDPEFAVDEAALEDREGPVGQQCHDVPVQDPAKKRTGPLDIFKQRPAEGVMGLGGRHGLAFRSCLAPRAGAGTAARAGAAAKH